MMINLPRDVDWARLLDVVLLCKEWYGGEDHHLHGRWPVLESAKDQL
jgi:hypothetical protein